MLTVGALVAEVAGQDGVWLEILERDLQGDDRILPGNATPK